MLFLASFKTNLLKLVEIPKISKNFLIDGGTITGEQNEFLINSNLKDILVFNHDFKNFV